MTVRSLSRPRRAREAGVRGEPGLGDAFRSPVEREVRSRRLAGRARPRRAIPAAARAVESEGSGPRGLRGRVAVSGGDGHAGAASPVRGFRRAAAEVPEPFRREVRSEKASGSGSAAPDTPFAAFHLQCGRLGPKRCREAEGARRSPGRSRRSPRSRRSSPLPGERRPVAPCSRPCRRASPENWPLHHALPHPPVPARRSGLRVARPPGVVRRPPDATVQTPQGEDPRPLPGSARAWVGRRRRNCPVGRRGPRRRPKPGAPPGSTAPPLRPAPLLPAAPRCGRPAKAAPTRPLRSRSRHRRHGPAAGPIFIRSLRLDPVVGGTLRPEPLPPDPLPPDPPPPGSPRPDPPVAPGSPLVLRPPERHAPAPLPEPGGSPSPRRRGPLRPVAVGGPSPLPVDLPARRVIHFPPCARSMSVARRGGLAGRIRFCLYSAPTRRRSRRVDTCRKPVENPADGARRRGLRRRSTPSYRR